MSADPDAPVLSRARLRRDSPVEALARLLVPDAPGARHGAAHSLVWALFADGRDRRRDFLWREMRPGEFLILSARPPSDPHGLFDLDSKPFDPALSRGQRLAFDLRANPVVSIPAQRGRRGKRRGLVAQTLQPIPPEARPAARDGAIREAAAAWLGRKGAEAGFEIDAERLHLDGDEEIRIRRGENSAVTFSALTFLGVLTVQDPVLFLRSVARGFGAAKAFGCGLMLIRRA